MIYFRTELSVASISLSGVAAVELSRARWRADLLLGIVWVGEWGVSASEGILSL